MLRNSVITTLMGLFMATTAFAQIKGGNVDWDRDAHLAMQEAKQKGLGIVLYFTSAG